MLNRAYSLLEVKEVTEDDDAYVVRGMATTPTPDRMNDVVDPLGATFAPQIPLLWQHNYEKPVGITELGKPMKKGIPFVSRIPKVKEAGALRDRIEEAVQSIRYKLVAAVSIGFRVLNDAIERLENGGYHYLQTEILELSLVTIPAQPDAKITGIKSIDERLRAASGQKQSHVVKLVTPGVSGIRKSVPEVNQMNVQDQIKQFQASRAAKAAALEACMKKSVDEGRTLDGQEQEEFDELNGEIESIDTHLKKLEQLQSVMASQAKAVKTVEPAADPVAKASENRDPRIILVEKKLEKGVGFARLAGCMAAAKGNRQEALQLAKERFPEEKQLHGIIQSVRFSDHSTIKAAVDIGTSRDTDWAAPLVNYQNLVNEFLEYLRPLTILDRIADRTRRVPFNVRVPRQTGGASASWVGEGAPKPVSALAFDFVSLGYMKLATIAVITQELARFSSPNADILVRNDLAKAIVQQMDADFVDPSNAGTSNIKPASITNGASAVPSTGNTYSDILIDIQSLFAPFIAANVSTRGAVWIMSETTALALSLIRLPANEGGGLAFPGITMDGGLFMGRPVIVSEAVGNIVILANAADILLADDGQVTIDASDQASVQMDSAPTNPVTASTVLISLWQQNLLGIRAERYVTWVKGRAESVQYLSGVSWGQLSS